MDAAQARKRFHAVIHGTVQGVGFRYSARQQAAALGLGGWVRNLWDGTVEVEAEGPADTLDRFLAWLRGGPAGAHVQRVQVHWRVPQNDDDPFEVRY